jgi:hypothetical protein
LLLCKPICRGVVLALRATAMATGEREVGVMSTPLTSPVTSAFSVGAASEYGIKINNGWLDLFTNLKLEFPVHFFKALS